MKATDEQIGGDHYSKYGIQPTEFIYKNGIPFIEGNIIKYVIRHKDKHGLEDLRKAKHYIDLLIQFEYGEQAESEKQSAKSFMRSIDLLDKRDNMVWSKVGSYGNSFVESLLEVGRSKVEPTITAKKKSVKKKPVKKTTKTIARKK